MDGQPTTPQHYNAAVDLIGRNLTARQGADGKTYRTYEGLLEAFPRLAERLAFGG